ncbi:ribonuclease Z (plasmid) [Pseudoalteromonas sp. T1lg65]|uniref:ribonuclease Z n=1 Tax=Pseudoalteromonas sp. T1lg65 TaxID=2077101 RepID=UPI003F78B4F6
MKVHFLGTSSGSPSKTRNVSATGVSFCNTKQWVLVDCGEATQHRLLASELSLYHLEVICITHLHGDHCYGLPGLIASIAQSGRTRPVTLIAPNEVIEFVRATLSMTQVELDFDLKMQSLDTLPKTSAFDFCDIEVSALQHRVPSVAYKITEVKVPKKLKIEKLKSEGVETGAHYNALQKGLDAIYDGRKLLAIDYTYPSWCPRKVVICGDNEKPSLLKPVIADIDLLVHEATFTSFDLNKVGGHTGHSDAKRICEFAKAAGVKHLILTHFSVRYHGKGMLKPLEKEAKQYFDGELTFAKDGLVIAVPEISN